MNEIGLHVHTCIYVHVYIYMYMYMYTLYVHVCKYPIIHKRTLNSFVGGREDIPHMSSIAYRRPTVLGYPILCVPLVISIRSKWEYPKWSCSLYLLSIPSRPITPMYQGQNGNIPNCTTPHACIPTVHPIPMYHRKEGTEWEHPKLYHPPSVFLLSIPSQCSLGRKG